MLYSFHITVGQSQYRIAYSLDHPHQLVRVHLIHSRENFYEKLKRLFGYEATSLRFGHPPETDHG